MADVTDMFIKSRRNIKVDLALNLSNLFTRAKR